MTKILKGKCLIPIGERKSQGPKTNLKKMSEPDRRAHKKRLAREAGLRRTERIKKAGKDDPQKRR